MAVATPERCLYFTLMVFYRPILLFTLHHIIHYALCSWDKLNKQSVLKRQQNFLLFYCVCICRTLLSGHLSRLKQCLMDLILLEDLFIYKYNKELFLSLYYCLTIT